MLRPLLLRMRSSPITTIGWFALRVGCKRWDCLQNLQPNAILTGIGLPGDMDGVDLLRELRAGEKLCKVPVLLVTVVNALRQPSSRSPGDETPGHDKRSTELRRRLRRRVSLCFGFASEELAFVLLLVRLMKNQATNDTDRSALQRDPNEWKTGDEPMTDAQRSYLETLCRETGEEFDQTLSKADASKRIDELRERSPRLAQE